MTFQCSLLSKNKENRVECPGRGSVHWFRAASGKSHPSIIYSHRNSTDDDLGRSCVYHFSKILQDSSDAGTYYCAVVTCGEILFGKGTQLNTRMYSQSRISSNLSCVFIRVKFKIKQLKKEKLFLNLCFYKMSHVLQLLAKTLSS